MEGENRKSIFFPRHGGEVSSPISKFRWKAAEAEIQENEIQEESRPSIFVRPGISSPVSKFRSKTAEIENSEMEEEEGQSIFEPCKLSSTLAEIEETKTETDPQAETEDSETEMAPVTEDEEEKHLSIFRPRKFQPNVEIESPPQKESEVEYICPNELSYPEEHYDDFKFRLDMSLYQRAKTSFDQILQCAEDLREAGNRKFKFDKHSEAIERYEKANKILTEAMMMNNKKETKAALELQYKLFANIAICHLRNDEPSQAAVACEAALAPGMPEPKNGKVFYRCAEANFKLSKLEDAKKYIEMALMFDPHHITLLNLRKQILKNIKDEKFELFKLYKKMCKAVKM